MSSPCIRATRQSQAKMSQKSKDSPTTAKGKTSKGRKTLPRTNSPYLPRKNNIKLEPVSPSSKNSPSSKLSVAKSEIKIGSNFDSIKGELNDDAPLSCLDELFSSSSDSAEHKTDTLDDLEIPSNELGDASLPLLAIPDTTRAEAGPNWRLKEALLNSYHFGKATLKATDFSRSQSEIKTAEIIADQTHSLASKKYYVKLHLGM